MLFRNLSWNSSVNNLIELKISEYWKYIVPKLQSFIVLRFRLWVIVIQGCADTILPGKGPLRIYKPFLLWWKFLQFNPI